jgi:hypothetical protein
MRTHRSDHAQDTGACRNLVRGGADQGLSTHATWRAPCAEVADLSSKHTFSETTYGPAVLASK